MQMTIKSILPIALCALSFHTSSAQSPQWPATSVETKAGSRWWWMGSAVDKANLKWNLGQYAATGLGTMEITPIYGVQGNDDKEISYLSDSWMNMLQYTIDEAAANGMQIDMNNGTGWPFGGPNVTLSEAASKLVTLTDLVTGDGATTISFSVAGDGTLNKVMAYPQTGNDNPITELTYLVNGNKLEWIAPAGQWRIIAIRNGYTGQQVKRAAKGGEGNVLDHFSASAVKKYLQRFDDAFERTGAQWPATVFNDSYEVYNADWTPGMFEEFEKYRGYKLEDNMDKLLGYTKDPDNKVLADYRLTLHDMLLNNFTKPWTEWAHGHGMLTRNQAHGSPGNLLDFYAAVDIPEIEGFGLTDFNIRGLRKDPGFVRDNYSDFTTLKWASSAAHVTGKKLTSSETFTWLTEHFRTSLSQMKPDLDLMFCAGVNRVFFHGTTYSPQEATWPAWKFYAAIDMSPTNSIWHDAPQLMQYIDRCQSFLQMGSPDNDLLVYAPFVNAMHKNSGSLFSSRLLTFPIDNINSKLSGFQTTVSAVNSAGYDCDYISDAQILQLTYADGRLRTQAGQEYAGMVIPIETYMPDATKHHLDSLKTLGAQIVTGTTTAKVESITGGKKEEIRSELGLRMIRRKNDTGYHYFISNLTHNDVAAWTRLGIDFATAVLFNPLDGSIQDAKTDGSRLFLSLKSGESVIIQTYDTPVHADTQWGETYECAAISLDTGWKLSFADSWPEVTGSYAIDSLKTWENLDDATAQLMGTGVYENSFTVSHQQMEMATAGFKVDLGDVRESARLYVNGTYVGTAWCAPFVLHTDAVKEGENTIRIEVTNLPANRIRQMDIDGKVWRIFEDVNILDVTADGVGQSGVTSYASWSKVPSGLNSAVTVVPCHNAEVVEARAELVSMQQDEADTAAYYPVYKLSISDGTSIEGDTEMVVRDCTGAYKRFTVTGTDGKTYEGMVPAYGAYTLSQNYDFAAATPLCGINNTSNLQINGFSDKVPGATAKKTGKELTFYDGLTFSSSLFNMIYYYVGYGIQSLRDMDAVFSASASDVAVLSYQAGNSSNSAKWEADNMSTQAVMAQAAGQQSMTMKSRGDAYIYSSLSVYSPKMKPTGVQPVAVSSVEKKQEALYNLQGQRVNANYRGIVVADGKKWINRR